MAASINEPTSRGFLTVPQSQIPHSIDELLSGASMDNTQLYLKHLPSELRRYVDRLRRPLPWHLTGKLTRVDLPAPERNTSRKYHIAVLANGERVLARCTRVLQWVDNESSTVIFRIDLPATDSRRALKIDGYPNKAVTWIEWPHQDPLLLLTNRTDTIFRMCDVNGAVVKEWPYEESPAEVPRCFRGMKYADGWLRVRRSLVHLARFETAVFDFPKRIFYAFAAYFGADGKEKVAISLDDTFEVWDLRSGTEEYRIENRNGYWDFQPKYNIALHLANSGYEDHVFRPDALHSLSTGRTLVRAEVLGDRDETAHLLVFGSWPSVPEQQTVTYWDARQPDCLSTVDFRDWTLRFVLAGGVAVCEKDGENFLYELDSKCGVRTDLAIVPDAPCWVASGAIIVYHIGKLWILPTFESDASPASTTLVSATSFVYLSARCILDQIDAPEMVPSPLPMHPPLFVNRVTAEMLQINMP